MTPPPDAEWFREHAIWQVAPDQWRVEGPIVRGTFPTRKSARLQVKTRVAL